MRRRALVAALVLASAPLSSGACSLGLDESLIPGGDGSIADAGGPEADASVDVHADALDGSSDHAAEDGKGGCTADPECASDAGCYEGRCDEGACVYELCPTTLACSARVCDPGSGHCGLPTVYHYHAGSLAVGDRLGCGGSAAACFATMGPFALVGTASGLAAWNFGDPLSPAKVGVALPPFAIERVVSNGKRTLIVGPLALGKLSIAWIDLPADPIATKLDVTSAAIQLDVPSVDYVFAGPGGGFYLVYADPSFPVLLLTPPVATGDALPTFPSTDWPGGEQPVASSGARLVGLQQDGAFNPYFSVESDPGSATAQNGGEVSLAGTGPVGPSTFVTGPDGSIAWSAGAVIGDPFAGFFVSSARLLWLADGATGSLGGATSVDYETYPSPYDPGTPVIGPAAFVSPSSVLVTAATANGTGETSVQLVTRSAGTVVLGANRAVLPFAPTRIAVGAAAGFGLVLTPPTMKPPAPPDTAIEVFAPACTP